MANGTVITSEWRDITSSFSPVSGVTGFEAYYNDKLKIVWLFGRTPTSYRTGNTIATISSTYAGEARNHTIGGFYGGDGVYNETVVNGTTLLARSTTGQQIQFSTSFDFYGFYRVH